VAVVTFSREAHSGTQDLARLLAERLGYRYVSRDELSEAVAAAGGLGRRPRTPESEGRSLSIWEQLADQLSGDRARYRAALKRLVLDLAVADNVVLVGHGAGLFLEGLPSVVRVFVVAPMADRVARVMAEDPMLDADQAARLVQREDRQSAAYLRYMFGVDWRDPHHWDLVVNTGRASIPAVVAMLADYTRNLVRDRPQQEELARLRLASRLEQALVDSPHLGLGRVRVGVEPDRIVLEGEALGPEDRAQAEALVRGLAPEPPIENRLVIRPPTSI
jgi:cytidylate kinase